MKQIIGTHAEIQEISKVINLYIEGARAGDSTIMRSAFHPDATFFGFVGKEFFTGPIDGLFSWNDENGAARSLEFEIACVDVIESVAAVRLELFNWSGSRFTDIFNLLRIDGDWKIMNKVFHHHD